MSTATTHIKTEKALVPALRFKEFKNVWDIVKLNDIMNLLTDFEANGSFAGVKENVTIYEEKEYAWYVRATDLEKQSSLDEVKYVDEHSYKFLKKTPLFGDELLVAKRGEIGKVYYYKKSEHPHATLAPNLYLLKLNELVEPYFIYSYFISYKGNKTLKRINASSTIGALYKDDVKALKLNIPQLPEQQKIASFLSAVDEKIQQLTKKKELLEQYKKGVMQKLFSGQLRFKDENGNPYPDWEEKTINQLFENVGGTALEKFSCETGSHKFISIGNYSTDGHYIDNGQRIDANEKSLTKLLNKGELVMVLNDKTKSGDIIGSTILIDEDDAYIYNQRSERLICNPIVQSKYAWTYLNSRKFRKEVFSVSQGGTQIYVNFPAIKQLIVLLPSLEEQQKIATYLSSIDTKIESVNNQITQTQTFKKGLLQQMFV